MSGSGYRPKRRGELGFPFTDLYINPNYRFKNIGTVLALRNFADSAYTNLAIQNLYLGTQKALDVSGTGMVMGGTTLSPRLPSFTTAERDAVLIPVNGDMIYNSTTNKVNIYQNGAWEELAIIP